MTTNYKVSDGKDFDDIFEPYAGGTKATTTNYRTSDGIDLNQRFMRKEDGDGSTAQVTSYTVSDGRDLNLVFAKKGGVATPVSWPALFWSGDTYSNTATANEPSDATADVIFYVFNNGLAQVRRADNGGSAYLIEEGNFTPTSGANAGDLEMRIVYVSGSTADRNDFSNWVALSGGTSLLGEMRFRSQVISTGTQSKSGTFRVEIRVRSNTSAATSAQFTASTTAEVIAAPDVVSPWDGNVYIANRLIEGSGILPSITLQVQTSGNFSIGMAGDSISGSPTTGSWLTSGSASDYEVWFDTSAMTYVDVNDAPNYTQVTTNKSIGVQMPSPQMLQGGGVLTVNFRRISDGQVFTSTMTMRVSDTTGGRA